ncbi:MAG: hypothetical protein WAN35_17415 [Terracidiphilus sp.]
MEQKVNEYRLNILGKAKLCFLGFASISLGGGFLLFQAANSIPLWGNMFNVLLILVGFYLIVSAFQYRIIFNKDTVTVVYPFSVRSLQRNEVKGRKYCRGWDGPSWHVLLANNPRSKRLTILKDVGFNKEWEDWYLSLPNLDYPQKLKTYMKKTGTHTKDRRHP